MKFDSPLCRIVSRRMPLLGEVRRSTSDPVPWALIAQ
jgi:hypothetical protein